VIPSALSSTFLIVPERKLGTWYLKPEIWKGFFNASAFSPFHKCHLKDSMRWGPAPVVPGVPSPGQEVFLDLSYVLTYLDSARFSAST
jgi:hypothetical protein